MVAKRTKWRLIFPLIEIRALFVDSYNNVVEALGKISCVANVAGTVDEGNWKNMVDLNLVSKCFPKSAGHKPQLTRR